VVAGDALTMKGLLVTYEAVTGRQLTERRLGSVEDLKAFADEQRRRAASPYE